MSTYSWPDNSMIAYMISSVIERRNMLRAFGDRAEDLGMTGPRSTFFKTASSTKINRLLASRLGQDSPMRLISCVPMTTASAIQNANRKSTLPTRTQYRIQAESREEAHRLPSLRTAFKQAVGVNCYYGLQA
jgi:hypothetical protein